MSRPRSFRLYQYQYSPPPKTVSDYSEAEKAEIRSTFRHQAALHAARSRKIAWIVCAFVACGIIVMCSRNGGLRLINFFIPCFVGFVVFALFEKSLLCSACRLDIEWIVTFCPECGGKVKLGGWFTSAQCLSCGKKLFRRRGRSYRIKYCSHCGVLLTEHAI